MSPFRSKVQAQAVYGGYLGKAMQQKAAQWADETPGGISSLPERVPGSGHTRYRLSIDRKDSLPKGLNMASKFVGKGTMPKITGKAMSKGKRGK